MISEPPNVRLRLSSRPENVMLVREVLYGIGKAIELEALVLNDIRIAVTEACNNVVLHAYEGGEGPLEVEVRASQGGLEVVVRDRGKGIRPQIKSVRDGSSGMGLLVIQALADRVAYQAPGARTDGGGRGGTEVCMGFATPGARNPAGRHSVDGASWEAGQLDLQDDSELATTTAVWIRPPGLAREVLPRLLSALAMRARFSTDRISDARLVADVLATRACESEVEQLALTVTVAERDLRLRVALPQADHDGHRTLDATLARLYPRIHLIADDRALATSGAGGALALRLVDDR